MTNFKRALKGTALALRSVQFAVPDTSFDCMLRLLRATSIEQLFEATRGFALMDHNVVARAPFGKHGPPVPPLVPVPPAPHRAPPAPATRTGNGASSASVDAATPPAPSAWQASPTSASPPGPAGRPATTASAPRSSTRSAPIAKWTPPGCSPRNPSPPTCA